MHLIRRRIVLLAMIAAAALAVPRPGGAADAASLPRIAFLSGDLTCAANPGFGALLDELRSLGYRDGETVSIHCRSAGSSYQRLDALASELVQLKPVVLVAAAAPASLAAKRATRNTPIISVYTADPVALGLVANLARPDGNVTGISALASDYVAKSLQLLREAAPGTSRVGVLGHIANSTYPLYQRELAAAAQTMGLAIDFAGVESVQQIDTALSDLRRRGADAFLIMHQPLTFAYRERIVNTVAAFRSPAMYGSREAVEAGGLISYAASVEATYRRAAYLVDRVLRGMKPGELPFEQPTKFELVVNLRAAKALGLTVPSSLLLRASQIVE